MYKYAIFVAHFVLFLALSAPANSAVITEDFVDGSGSFALESSFDYDFDLLTPGLQGMTATGSDFSGFGDFSAPAPGGLGLFPDQVEVSFSSLGVVTAAALTLESFSPSAGSTLVEFLGTSGGSADSVIYAPPVGSFSFSSGPLDTVSSIRVSSFESVLTGISVTTAPAMPVPAPAALLLLGLAGIAAMRR